MQEDWNYYESVYTSISTKNYFFSKLRYEKKKILKSFFFTWFHTLVARKKKQTNKTKAQKTT